MKKITAFFMALMPLLVTVLLFAAGLIVKNSTHVYVSGVEMTHDSLQIRKPDENPKQYQLEAAVIPTNATNPSLTWTCSNKDVLEVNNEGLVTCKDFGEAYVYATSKENQTISSSCKITVFDDKIHNIVVTNEDQVSYVGVDQTQKIKVETKPEIAYLKDASLKYEVTKGSDILSVNSDGIVVPKGIGDATVLISSDSQNDNIKKEVNIKVGVGFNTISLKNPLLETIPESSYNLFNQIVTAPETNIKPSDFKYESSNELLATVDENGVANFKDAGVVTFTITCKRNPELKVEKIINSTCKYLERIYFDRTKVDVVFGSKDKLDANDLKWSTYPNNKTNVDNITFLSSNENVIKVEKTSNSVNFLIKAPGTVTLNAIVQTNKDSYSMDSCEINVSLPNNNFIHETTVSIDNLYYPLINSIKGSDIKQLDDIEFTCDSSDVEIDANKIAHFKKEGQYTFKVKKNGIEETFAIYCSNVKVVEKPVEETITVQPGQLIKLKSNENWQPVFEGKIYADNFFANADSSFIAKSGTCIEEFELKNSSTTKKVKLIVTEAPIAIKSDINSLIYTSEVENYVYDWLNPSVYPSTATKQDGANYTISYQYKDPINKEVKELATIEDDYITFNKSGALEVTVSANDNNSISKTFTIFSTFYNEINKFTIQDMSSVEIPTYSTIKLNPGETKVLTSKEITSQPQEGWLSISSSTLLCETPNPEWKTNHIEFTIKAPTDYYGKDVIRIKSGTHEVFINVEVNSYINDFLVTKSNVVLSNTNKTYTKNLILKVLPVPNNTESTYDVLFNNNPLTITNNYVDLSSATWNENADNTLTVKSKDDGGFSKSYTITHSTQKPKCWLAGSEDFDLNLACYATQKTAEIATDGFVDSDWFKNNVHYKLVKKDKEEVSISENYLSITGIPSPTSIPTAYTNQLKVWLGSETEPSDPSQVQTYNIARDVVSKIVLPKHDNDDMTDKKGFQKVHVYGNKSFYAEDTDVVDYYKLPVELYDSNRQLIKNTETNPLAVYNALQTLKVSATNNTTVTFEKEGYIKIKFNDKQLYDEEQIYNNKFVEGQKNVDFKISTKSNEYSAKYTFVPVDGINAYSKETFRKDRGWDGAYVLQTNFSKEGAEKDNVILDYPRGPDQTYRVIYGNGYTINFWAHAKNDVYKARMGHVLNTYVQGVNNEDMKKKDINFYIETNFWHGDVHHRYFAYNAFYNLPGGVHTAYHKQAPDLFYHIKNCLFYNSKTFALTSDKLGHVYVEDCIFFDAASFAIDLSQECKMYFKGFIDVYNFQGRRLFENLYGFNLGWLWDTIVFPAAKQYNMLQTTPEGTAVFNSFMANLLTDQTYFWNNTKKIYERSDAGNPYAANHQKNFCYIEPAALGRIGLWGSSNPSSEPGAPSYYDEFDKDGNLRWDFLSNQIKKIERY